MHFFRRRNSVKNYQHELYVACGRHPAPCPEEVQKYIRLDPNATRIRDKLGNTLLHIVCARPQTPLSVVQSLVKVCPDLVRVTNPRDGSLPLHVAVASQADIQLVQFLLEKYPRGAHVADKHGLYPLHSACLYKASFEVFLLLLQAWPEAVRHRNIVDKTLPLHGACTRIPATFESLNGYSFEVIWSLLEAHPDAVMSHDANGDTPYDLLKRGNPPKDLLKLMRTKRALAQMPEQERQRAEDRERRKLMLKNAIMADATGDHSCASTSSQMSWGDDTEAAQVVEIQSARKKKKKISRKKKRNFVEELGVDL